MPRIAITGHMDLSATTVPLVSDALRGRLTELAAGSEPVVGISCLAAGADTVFAETVLEVGGLLEVVLPSADYRSTQVRSEDAPAFDALVTSASEVHTMQFPHAGREAYAAANQYMLSRADQLIAVWDGRPSPDQGGTAGAVEEARRLGLQVTVVWPAGAARG